MVYRDAYGGLREEDRIFRVEKIELEGFAKLQKKKRNKLKRPASAITKREGSSRKSSIAEVQKDVFRKVSVARHIENEKS